MSVGSADFVNQTLLLLHTRQSFSAVSKDLFLVSVLSKSLSGYVSGELRALGQPGQQQQEQEDGPMSPSPLVHQGSIPEIMLEGVEVGKATAMENGKGSPRADGAPTPVTASSHSSLTRSNKSPVPPDASIDGTILFRIVHRLLQNFGADRSDSLLIAQRLVDIGVLRPVSDGADSPGSQSGFDEDESYVVDPHAADSPEAQGVLTKFTRCYSPTCKITSTCYSPTCHRVAMASKNYLTRRNLENEFKISLSEDHKLWSDSVPESVLKSVSSEEVKCQEIIFELISSEKDYLRDLEVMKTHFWVPIENGEVPVEDPEQFLRNVFGNLYDRIRLHNTAFIAMRDGQLRRPVFSNFGEVFVKAIDGMGLYVDFNTGYIRSKVFLEKELEQNPAFLKHYKLKQKHPDCRKLPLESFLSLGVSRLPRYKLYLETLIQNMGPNHSDRTHVEKCIEKLKGILNNIDRETGRAHTRILMEELAAQLVLKKGQAEDTVKMLGLDHPERQIYFSGVVERYRDAANEAMRIKLFLLDNYLILTEEKDKRRKDGSSLKLFCDPIHIELLEFMEEGEMEARLAARTANASKDFAQEGTLRTSGVFRVASLSRAKTPPKQPKEKGIKRMQTWDGGEVLGALKDFAFAIRSVKTDEYHLFGVAKSQEKLTWQKAIEVAKQALQEKRAIIFRQVPLGRPWAFFSKPVSITKFDDETSNKETLLVATDQGVYLGRPTQTEAVSNFEFIIQIPKTLKIRMKKGLKCMFVLAGDPARVYAIPFSALQSSKKPITLRSDYKIHHTSGTTHFLVGTKGGRTFLCCVRIKNSLTSSQRLVVILELQPDPKSHGFICHVLKEFEIQDEPSSVRLDLFPNAVCTIGHSKIMFVDFSSGGMKEILVKNLPPGLVVTSPRRIFQLPNNELFVCTVEFGVFVNTFYEYTRESVIKWLGVPTSFAMKNKFIMAFNPTFIEVYDSATGALRQIIPLMDGQLLSENDDSNEDDRVLISSLNPDQLGISEIRPVSQ